MASLRSTLAETTRILKSVNGQTTAMDIVDQIETAGAPLGALQVTCCTPSRMPLHEILLHNLMEIQRSVTRYAEAADQ